ncbi:YuzF family protein [Robertmurraya korlensis]|uniref:YuzF family protein n=1 Tax=Robertmurraya korlensis TaxID=519977 RepID=UPI00203CA9A1|nr:YuzF family protein [Robertmurraya korlensis]MCM3601890.1 YuzF family protein [Robertmurraya korlensis]
MNQQTPSFVSHIDSYVYHAFQGIIGRMVAVQTVRGTVTGLLKSVMPDHIVVESGGSPFFIRTQQIIWVIPRA